MLYHEPCDILTLEDLCLALNIGKNTAYSLLQTNQISAFRIGRTWKIPRQSLENYILSKSNLVTACPDYK